MGPGRQSKTIHARTTAPHWFRQHVFSVMPRLRDLSIRAKLLLTLLGIGGLSVGIMGWIGYSSARQRLESEALGRLAGVQANKANAVEAYVEDLRRQVVTTSKDDQTVRAMQKFRSAFRVLDARNAAPIGGGTAAVRTYYEDEFGPRLEEGTGTDGAAASYVPEEGHIQYLQNKYIASNPHPVGEKDRLDRPGEGWEVYHVPHARYHDAFRRLLHAFNHADLFLVEPDNGHVVYSVQKEVDFGTSLLDGPYRDSNLAEAFRAARGAETGDAHRMVDFAAYGPSHGAPASFVASPIMDAGEVIGVLVFQVSVGEINETLTGGQDWAAEGLGETGETVLVGADRRMRTDARFLLEDQDAYLQTLRSQGHDDATIDRIDALNTTILQQEVRMEAVDRALAGSTGRTTEADYRGEAVLSAYGPVDLEGVNWAVVSKIDRDEALAAVDALTGRIALWGGALLVLVAGIAFVVVRSLTRPLLALRDAARKATAGTLDAAVPVEGQDEVGELTAAFNEMVDQNRRARDDAAAQEEAARQARQEAEAARNRLERQRADLQDDIATMGAAMDRFANGDLTVRLDAGRDDEMGRLHERFNRAVENLRRMVVRVREAAGAAAASAGQIEASSEQMAASAEEQSARSEAVAAAVDELGRTIDENRTTVQRTADAAAAGGEQARRGGEVVDDMARKIDEIADVVAHSAETIERLGASSEEIGEIVETINEIADRTNLLALNAGIEAARAGEEGQGFAVVAEEVRTLAERTDRATDEIAEMIGQVQSETDEAVESVRAGTRRVEEGLELADEAGTVLDEIVDSIARVEERTDDIAAASEQQSTTTDEIAQSVQSISTAAQASSASVTQVAGSAADLNALTETLRESVRPFRVERDGHAEAHEGTPTPDRGGSPDGAQESRRDAGADRCSEEEPLRGADSSRAVSKEQ